MTDDERKVLNETVAVVAVILDRLQWDDLGSQWSKRIMEPLKRMQQSQDNGRADP